MANNRKRGQGSSWTVAPTEGQGQGQEQEEQEGEDCILSM
jgi:hypothetical protein